MAEPTPATPVTETENIITQLQKSSFGWFVNALSAMEDVVPPGSFSLPRVVVVGAEKAGKSSMLEAITKCAIFPRDLQIMTRCPVRFELVGTPKGEPTQTTLTYKKKSMVLDRDEDVNGAIHAIFHGIGNTITYDEIVIKRTGPGLPTLSFIDLPGIRVLPDNLDLSGKTQSLVDYYINEQEARKQYPKRAVEARDRHEASEAVREAEAREKGTAFRPLPFDFPSLETVVRTIKDTIIICCVDATTAALAASHGVASVVRAGKAAQTILALSKGDLVKPERYEQGIVRRVLTGAAELEVNGVPVRFAACVATRCRDQREGDAGSALPPENLTLLQDSDALEAEWANKFIADLKAVDSPRPADQLATLRASLTVSNLLVQLDYFYQYFICTKWRVPATEKIKSLIAPVELTEAEVADIVANGRINTPELAAKVSELFNIDKLDTVRITARLSALLDIVKLGKDPRDLSPASLLGDVQGQLAGRMVARPTVPAFGSIEAPPDSREAAEQAKALEQRVLTWAGSKLDAAAPADVLGLDELKELTGSAFNSVLPMKTERFVEARGLLEGKYKTKVVSLVQAESEGIRARARDQVRIAVCDRGVVDTEVLRVAREALYFCIAPALDTPTELASDAAWIEANGATLLTEAPAHANARTIANLRLAKLLVARDIVRDICPCGGDHTVATTFEAHTKLLKTSTVERPVASADAIAARAAELAASGSTNLVAQAQIVLKDATL